MIQQQVGQKFNCFSTTKNIIPVCTIKEMYPNNYQETRCKFIVGKIKKHEN